MNSEVNCANSNQFQNSSLTSDKFRGYFQYTEDCKCMTDFQANNDDEAIQRVGRATKLSNFLMKTTLE